MDFLPKVKLEVAIANDMVDKIIESISKAANTGKIGDGKIAVLPLDHVMRIRTKEEGAAALL